jgi:amino acid adenylation domain-containing protein
VYLLHHLLEESSRKHPDRNAVVSKDKSITYADLEIKSNQLALTLSQQGIKKGDRVGIMLSKSIESIIALFGIMKAGAIYVPLDPLAPVNRVNHIISHCGIVWLITSHEHLRKIWSDQQVVLPFKKTILTGQPSNDGTCNKDIDCLAWEAIEANPSDHYFSVELSDTCPAYILHTSGSTGTPKGVVISHLNALAFVNMAVDFFNIHEDDRIANHAPLHFDLSVFDIFGAIKAGATIVIVPESLSTFPAKLAEYIDQERISIWNSVSSVLTMLADRGRLDRFGFDTMRLVHFSGDIMPVKYLRILKNHMKSAAFYNIYGQTEANSSLFYPVRETPNNEAWKIPIGQAFPNFEVFALNEVNEMINFPGEEGELYVSSSTVALGYWNDEKMTLEKFVVDPRHNSWAARVYKTGDLVRIDDHGNYIFVGRKDHMIKSRGYRIELAEIEIVLNNHPNVSQAVVITVPEELIGNRIIAYISLKEGVNVSAEEIAAYCHTLLPRYMVPEEILIIDKLSRTTTGKADRKLMTEIYLSVKTSHKLSGKEIN